MPRQILSSVAVPLLLLAGLRWLGASQRGERPLPVPEERLLVGPMGFCAPGPLYMLSNRNSISLGFADNDHVLLTFRQPSLLRHEQSSKGVDEGQVIRALVVHLPGGEVSASAEWRMFDHSRYLWPLPGGKFLIRRGDAYFITDTSLTLHPFVAVPTRVLRTEVSPDGKTLVVEHQYERHTPEEHRRLAAEAERFGDPPPEEDTQISVLDIPTRKVVAAFRVQSPVSIPISGEGYLGVSTEKSNQFLLRFVPFQGEPVPLGQVASACTPSETFLNQKALIIESCDPKSPDVFLDVWTSDAKRLWSGRREGHLVRPRLAFSFSGTRFAAGFLRVSHPIDTADSLNDEDVKEQVVQVFDTASGTPLLATTASPVLAAGQNFALSAEGDRLAVLRDGAIEIYKVPSQAPQVASAAQGKR
jgi:hypothetical protein